MLLTQCDKCNRAQKVYPYPNGWVKVALTHGIGADDNRLPTVSEFDLCTDCYAFMKNLWDLKCN